MQIWSTILFVNSLQSLNAGHKNENQQPKIFNSWWFIGHWPQVPALLKKAHAIRNQSCTIQKHEGKFQGFALCISSGEVVYGSHFYFCTWRVPLTFVCFFAVSFMLILLQILTILFFVQDIEIQAGATLSWPIWFHAATPGNVSLYISIYYEMESSSDIKYRTLRMHYNLEVTCFHHV